MHTALRIIAATPLRTVPPVPRPRPGPKATAMRPKHDAARAWRLSLVVVLCLMFMLFGFDARAFAVGFPP
jgi:hypothetical protein